MAEHHVVQQKHSKSTTTISKLKKNYTHTEQTLVLGSDFEDLVFRGGSHHRGFSERPIIPEYTAACRDLKIMCQVLSESQALP